MSKTARGILIALAKHANRDGLAWPSVSTLASLAGTDPRNARRALRKLEAAKTIRPVPRRSGFRSAAYAILQYPPGTLAESAPPSGLIQPAPPGRISQPPLADSTSQTRTGTGTGTGTTTTERAMVNQTLEKAKSIGVSELAYNLLLSQHGEQDVKKYVTYAYDHRSELRNPVGWLHAAIKNRYDIPADSARSAHRAVPGGVGSLSVIAQRTLETLDESSLKSWADACIRAFPKLNPDAIRQNPRRTFVLEWIAQQIRDGKQPE